MKVSRFIPLLAILCGIGVGTSASLAQTPNKATAKTPAPKITTGPEVGQMAPNFEVLDQHGETQTLESLAGPNGLLLLFHRSADW